MPLKHKQLHSVCCQMDIDGLSKNVNKAQILLIFSKVPKCKQGQEEKTE